MPKCDMAWYLPCLDLLPISAGSGQFKMVPTSTAVAPNICGTISRSCVRQCRLVTSRTTYPDLSNDMGAVVHCLVSGVSNTRYILARDDRLSLTFEAMALA